MPCPNNPSKRFVPVWSARTCEASSAARRRLGNRVRLGDATLWTCTHGRQIGPRAAGLWIATVFVVKRFSGTALGSRSLSEILCLRHTMANERSQYAHPQDEESGGRRHHAGVDQA